MTFEEFYTTKGTTYHDWFDMYFPGAYVCALGAKGIVLEHKVDDHPNQDLREQYQRANAGGAAILFTPNGIQHESGRHKLENFSHINAWYLDVDIQDTKGEDTDGVRHLRSIRKAALRGRIWYAPVQPSITVESRNGFHLYWLAHDGTPERFAEIERRLYRYFQPDGADISSTKIVTLLRLPGYANTKGGGWFPVHVEPALCSYHSDDTYQGYGEETMLKMFPDYERGVAEKDHGGVDGPVSYRPPSRVSLGTSDIFTAAKGIPIRGALERLSGTGIVSGENFTFRSVAGGRHLNLVVDGRSVNCWIDVPNNQIFGPKGTKYNGPTLAQWLKYYGHEWSEIAETLKQLLNTF